MKKYLLKRKITAVFFTINFLITIVPYNSIYADNSGPKAPEAGAFEPVESTDMVSLSTGDFTYVLPLLNIPGSYGGYPLALSYHAGIATDQESSWVGLGWSLNPGSIDRNINRIPDDWNQQQSSEYYWDEGTTLKQTSYGVTVPLLSGLTIGGAYSHGSLRGSSGSISLGYGPISFTASSDGFSAGAYGFSISQSMANGTSVGLQIGTFGVNHNFNGGGTTYSVTPLRGALKVGKTTLHGDFTLSYNPKTGTSDAFFNYSASYVAKAPKSGGNTSTENKGVGMSLKRSFISGGSYSVMGSGDNQTFTSIDPADYHQKYNSTGFNLIVVSYKHETLDIWVDKDKSVFTTGSLYKIDGSNQAFSERVYCRHYAAKKAIKDRDEALRLIDLQPEVRDQLWSRYRIIEKPNLSLEENLYNGFYQQAYDDCVIDPISKGFEYYSYTDITENFGLYNSYNYVDFDDYNVTGQGIAGHISPKIIGNPNMSPYEIGDLAGQEKYHYFNDNVDRTNKVDFFFKSMLSYKSKANSIHFKENPRSLSDFIVNPSDSEITTGNDKSGNYTKYYTYKELNNNTNLDGIVYPENGLSKPIEVDEDAIAGFAITSTDGVTYHYMRPVYNYLYKQRKIGDKGDGKEFNESTKPAYATHWLLTGITGSDYFDVNENNKVDEGDYGYWVNFTYGHWSNGGMVWRNPSDLNKKHDKETLSYMWGIKDLFYLDKINTNTHTALFIKDVREDAKGVPLSYIDKNEVITTTLPSQKQLLLDRIIVVKNKDAASIRTVNKRALVNKPHEFFGFTDPRTEKRQNMFLSKMHHVLDKNDFDPINQTTTLKNSLSEVHFTYDYSLAKGAPNSDENGKLTLKRVSNRGFEGASIMPDYVFSYSNNPNWQCDLDNAWGYLINNPTAWSLDKITTPTGAEINIVHERDEFSVLNRDIRKDEDNNIKRVKIDLDNIIYFENRINNGNGRIKGQASIGNHEINKGDTFTINYQSFAPYQEWWDDYGNYLQGYIISGYKGEVKVTDTFFRSSDKENYIKFETTEPENFISEFHRDEECNQIQLGDPETEIVNEGCEQYEFWQTFTATQEIKPGENILSKGDSGIRVASITTTSDTDSYTTRYHYALGEIPYEPKYDNYNPLHTLLSSPITLYPKITVTKYGTNNTYEYQEEYNFNTYSRFKNNYYQDKLDFINETSYRDSHFYTRLGDKSLLGKVVSVNDYKSNTGLLTSVVHRKKDGTIIFKEENNYEYADVDSPFTDVDALQVVRENKRLGGEPLFYNMTQIRRFPSILKSKITTAGGKQKIVKFENFDPYTGIPKTHIDFNANGEIIKTEALLAREVYLGMGSKCDNISNSNMLVQGAGNTVWTKSDHDAQYKLLSSTVETWHNNWDFTDYKGVTISNTAWRKHKAYTWKGKGTGTGLNTDGTIRNSEEASNFRWWHNQTPPLDSGWQKNYEIKRYNQYSEELETEDLNGDRTSKKLDIKNLKTIAVCDTDYDNFYYAGFEDYSRAIDGSAGEINLALSKTNVSHTGSYGLNITNNWNALKNRNQKTGKYKISFWSKSQTLKVNNKDATEIVKAGDWYLNNYYLSLNKGDQVTISGSGIIDDFRMCPLNSSMVSYVYNNLDLLTHIIADNGLATQYRYNTDNYELEEVLTEVIDEGTITGGFKIISKYKKEYKTRN